MLDQNHIEHHYPTMDSGDSITANSTRFSLLDSHFSESSTTLTISSINSNAQHHKQPMDVSSASLLRPPHNNSISLSHRKPDNGSSLDRSLLDPIITDATSSQLDNNNFNINRTPVINDNQILADLYTTPDINTFDTNYYAPETPLTPITPITPVSPQFCLNSKIPPFPRNTRVKYPLNDSQLDKFVLDPSIFYLQLGQKIGRGGNAFVHSCELSTIASMDRPFNIAIKIPSARNKVRYIIQEAKFALKLREYQHEWFESENRLYPFIDCYGLYYLNKEQFPLFKPTDEFPCLLLKKMSKALPEFIKSQTTTKSTDPKLPLASWWKLCQMLLDALLILKRLKCVHCDLKTENVLVLNHDDANGYTEDTLFKVIDFSSASAIDEMTKRPDMTLQYTAPELLDFGSNQMPTFQSDLFSAGLVLLEAATGSAPYATVGDDHFYLLTVIKEGRVLDWISAEDTNIVQAHPEIAHILRLMLVDRCDVETVTAYVHSIV